MFTIYTPLHSIYSPPFPHLHSLRAPAIGAASLGGLRERSDREPRPR